MPIMTLPPGMRCLGHGRRGPLGLPPGMLALASESIAEPAAPHSISKFIANHPVYKEHIARGDSPAEAMDAANLATFADHPVYQQRIAKGDSPLKAADAAEASMLRTALSRVMADRRRERSARQSQSVTKSRSAVSTGETALGRGDKTAIGHGQGPRPAEPVQSVSPGSQAATTQAAARQTEAEISPQKRFIKRLVKAGYSAESAESEAARMLAGKTPAEILNLAKWSEGIPDSYFAPSGIVGRTHDQSWHEIFQAERAANRERVFNTVHPEAARPMPHATPPRPKQGRGRYSNYAEAGFSNEPLELAGTEPVEQEPWQEYGIGGGESPIKYKFVSLHDGPGPAPADADTLFFQATPQVKIDTRERMRPRVENNLDWPHYVDFRRGEGQEGASSGSFDITNEGKASKILSHAVHAISELGREYRPADIHFTAAEDSRVKAYKHVMRRVAADPEMRKNYLFLTRRGTASRPESGSFYVVHKAVAHLPEYQNLLPIGGEREKTRLPPGMKPVAGPGAAVATANLPNLPPGMFVASRG